MLVYQHEFETFSASSATVWLRIPKLLAISAESVKSSSQGRHELWMYHSNPNFASGSARVAANLFTPSETWSRYDRVYHMTQSRTDVLVNSAAPPGVNDAQAFGDVSGVTTTMLTPTAAAMTLDGNGYYVDDDYTIATEDLEERSLSVELWLTPESCDSNEDRDRFIIFSITEPPHPSEPAQGAFDDANFFFRLALSTDCDFLTIMEGIDDYRSDEQRILLFGRSLNDTFLHHLVVNVRPRFGSAKKNVELFHNGELVALYVSEFLSRAITSNLAIRVGGPALEAPKKGRGDDARFRWAGVLDEVRVSSQARLGNTEERVFLHYVSAFGLAVQPVDPPRCQHVSAKYSTLWVVNGTSYPTVGERMQVVAGTPFVLRSAARDSANKTLTGGCRDEQLWYELRAWPAVEGPTSSRLQSHRMEYLWEGVLGNDESAVRMDHALQWTVSVDLPGLEANVGVMNVDVQPAQASASGSYVVGDPRSRSFDRNETASLEIVLRDRFLNVQPNADPSELQVLTSAPGRVNADVTNQGDGTWRVELSSAAVGTSNLTVLVNGARLTLIDVIVTEAGGATNPNDPDNSEAAAASGADPAVIGVSAVLAVVVIAAGALFGYRRWRESQEGKMPDLTAHMFQIDDASHVARGAFGSEAHEMLREILLETDVKVGKAIIQSVESNRKLNEAIKAVFYFYHVEDMGERIMALMKTFISEKVVEAMAAGKGNLFRTDNAATKSMNVYIRMTALPYVYTVLKPVLQATMTQSVELDPTRVDATNESHDADLSRYTILQAAQSAFVNITSSLKSMPPGMREVARHLDAEVREAFLNAGHGGENSAEEADKVARIALAGMLFLRTFCPALSAPTAFGFLDERPEPDQRRMLTLITKTLQNLANGVRFGSKEAYMQQLNDFMDSNAEKIVKYFGRVVAHNAADSGGPPPPVVPPPADTRDWALSVIFRVLHDNIDAVLARIPPHLRGRLKRAVALSEPPVPPRAEWQMSGWLRKQGGRIKTWKSRFFVLRDEFLWYSTDVPAGGVQVESPAERIRRAREGRSKEDDESGAEAQLKGVICLEGASILQRDGSVLIDHPHVRTYVLEEDERTNAGELNQWATKLRIAIRETSKQAVRRASQMVGGAGAGAGGVGGARDPHQAVHLNLLRMDAVPELPPKLPPKRSASSSARQGEPSESRVLAEDDQEEDESKDESDDETPLETSSLVASSSRVSLPGVEVEQVEHGLEFDPALVERNVYPEGYNVPNTPWHIYYTDGNEAYFSNVATGESSWLCPAELRQ